MKNDVNLLKLIPKSAGLGFGLCVFGKPSYELSSLMMECGMVEMEGGKFTNFLPTAVVDFAKMFEPKKFKYMDGFSPNMNKHMHVGHFSNLVLGKAFQSMGIAETTVALLGDTEDGAVGFEEANTKYLDTCNKFGYVIDGVHLASKMPVPDGLVPGDGDYAGTQVVQIDDKLVVAVKSSGKTTYFAQDMSFASMLDSDTLYLTGYEQASHFKSLSVLYPHVSHIGLGLVKLHSGKMSTRLGNVVYMQDLMDELYEKFGDLAICYNVFAGTILKSHPTTDKVFSTDTMANPKNSPGLYISYTMARLKSAGVVPVGGEFFQKASMKYGYAKSTSQLTTLPLFDAVVELCEEINALYIDHKIVGNADNTMMFGRLLSDLKLGMKKLGLLEVERV